MEQEVLTLTEFINKYFDGNRKLFSDTQGIKPAQPYQWEAKNFIVVDGVMYSKRRELLK